MWNKIQVAVPSEGQQVLGVSYGVLVLGFWDSVENCLQQFSDGGDGYKWAFTHWMPVPALPAAE